MLDSKKLALEDLDGIAGGTIIESYHVGFMLQDAGYNVFNKDGVTLNFDSFRSALKGMGVEDINDHGGIINSNSYTIGGKTLNNEEFINFLVKDKGCKDLGVTAYTERFLKNLIK